MRHKKIVAASGFGVFLSGIWTACERAWETMTTAAHLDFARQAITPDSEVRHFWWGALQSTSSVPLFWPMGLTILCLSVLAWAIFWPEKKPVGAIPENSRGPEPMPQMSLAEAVEYLIRWQAKQPAPHPDDLQAWAFAELEKAITGDFVTAYGERGSMESEAPWVFEKMPSKFMHGARFEFQDMGGDAKFDGGLAYRDRDERFYAGVRLDQTEIEARWPT